jgi:hypothetical protein
MLQHAFFPLSLLNTMRQLFASSIEFSRASVDELSSERHSLGRLVLDNGRLRLLVGNKWTNIATTDSALVTEDGAQTLTNKNVAADANTYTAVTIKIHGTSVEPSSMTRQLMSFASMCDFCTSNAVEMVDGGVRVNKRGIYRVDVTATTNEGRGGAVIALSVGVSDVDVACARAPKTSGPASLSITWTGRVLPGDLVRVWNRSECTFGHETNVTHQTAMTVTLVSA